MPVFVLFCPHIGYPNHYAAIGPIQAFYLLRSRISHTNSYAVVGTTPLICAWAVMSCLLSRTIYIIRCVAVWNEMVFVGRTSNTKQGWHTVRNRPCTYSLHCINNRVAVGLLGDEFYVKAFIATGLLQLVLRKLPRSGWSVGRAGLGARATYPA